MSKPDSKSRHHFSVLHVVSPAEGRLDAWRQDLLTALRDEGWKMPVVLVREEDEISDEFVEAKSRSLPRKGIFFGLRRLLREENPDVVHIWAESVKFSASLAARLSGRKNIVWGHPSRKRSVAEEKASCVEKMKGLLAAAATQKLPRCIISDSLDVLQRFREVGCSSACLRWIPNGICTWRFAPDPDASAALRGSLGIPVDAAVAGFIWTQSSEKQLPLFFHAAAVLQAARSDAWFVICGGLAQDLEPAARIACRLMPDPSRVRILPTRTDMEHVYPIFDSLALPTAIDSWPEIILEALSCGVPCLAPEVGDCPEVIGDAGAIVEPDDPLALAAAWQRLFSLDRSQRFNLSRRARERVVRCFSLDRTAAAYAAVYEELLA